MIELYGAIIPSVAIHSRACREADERASRHYVARCVRDGDREMRMFRSLGSVSVVVCPRKIDCVTEEIAVGIRLVESIARVVVRP